MNKYHKIQTVYLRNPGDKYKSLLVGYYSQPEFDYLSDNEWVFTEKVDGTNIRVMIDSGNINRYGRIMFGGKTDRASIPAFLVSVLEAKFLPQQETLFEQFPDGACLYGEGYGNKIQKIGGLYKPDQDFVLFDIKVGDWWLERETVRELGIKFNVGVVPEIGRGTLTDMVEKTREGFRSIWGDFTAEGIVARPSVELKTRGGHRIITKIKHKDFV